MPLDADSSRLLASPVELYFHLIGLRGQVRSITEAAGQAMGDYDPREGGQFPLLAVVIFGSSFGGALEEWIEHLKPAVLRATVNDPERAGDQKSE